MTAGGIFIQYLLCVCFDSPRSLFFCPFLISPVFFFLHVFICLHSPLPSLSWLLLSSSDPSFSRHTLVHYLRLTILFFILSLRLVPPDLYSALEDLWNARTFLPLLVWFSVSLSFCSARTGLPHTESCSIVMPFHVEFYGKCAGAST